MNWDEIDGVDGARPLPVPPAEAVDAVIAIGWDEGGAPRQPRGWGVVYGMPNGTLRIERGLDFRDVRRLVGFQWELMTDEVAAGRRYGTRQTRSDTWVTTQRCSDGVTRVFTAKGRSARQARRRPVLPVATRFAVLERDRFRCRYCGDGPEGVRLHVDHVHPRSKGGSDDIDNLVTACESCNMGKLDREGVQVP